MIDWYWISNYRGFAEAVQLLRAQTTSFLAQSYNKGILYGASFACSIIGVLHWTNFITINWGKENKKKEEKKNNSVVKYYQEKEEATAE